MTNLEILASIFDDSSVNDALLKLSAHGELNELNLHAAIPDYYLACSAIATSLISIGVHKTEDYASGLAPFVLLGQLGSLPGISQDMVLYNMKKANVAEKDLGTHINTQLDEGNDGKPNLCHGIVNMEVIGASLQEINNALQIKAAEHVLEDAGNIMDQQVDHPFGAH